VKLRKYHHLRSFKDIQIREHGHVFFAFLDVSPLNAGLTSSAQKTTLRFIYMRSPFCVSNHLPFPATKSELTDDQQSEELAAITAILREVQENPASTDHAALSKVASRLRKISPKYGTDRQFEALTKVCLFFLSRDKDLAYALEAAAYMIKLARQLGRGHELLTGLSIQTNIAAQLDNYIEAMESCAETREVAVSLALPRAEMITLVNAGALHINTGYYTEALELLRTALTVADRANDVDDVTAEALSNIAQCNLFLSQYSDGLKAIQAARAYSGEPADAFRAGNRANLEFTHLRLLVALGRGKEARPVLLEMEKYVRQAGSARSKIDYAMARGMVEVVEGQLDLGTSRMVVALEKSRLVRSTLPDVLSGLVTTHTVIGQADEAAKYREELDSLLRSRQATSRLRAALIWGPTIGTAGQVPPIQEYDRRFDAARERLLRQN
jgi:tetratricopeptide (TPR) repeat protein